MLSQMRSASKSWLIYVAFGILIVVFTFYFGPQTEGCQPSGRQTAAVVNGTEIDNIDLSILMNRVARSRQKLDDAEYNKMQAQVTEKLVLLYLLADDAREQGLEISPEELSAFILDGRRNVDYSYYSDKEGVFDAESYDRFVKYGMEVTVEQYEEFKARELLARKYLTTLDQTLSLVPKEVEEANTLRNTKAELEFIKIDPKQLASAITFTPEEIKAFGVKEAAAIQKYYDDNKKDFQQPKRVHIRRLMVKKATDSADDAAKAKAEQNWTAAKSRVLEKKEDFEAVVKDLSEDIAYKDKGGDMGWSQLGDMNQDMAKVVESMKIGDIKEYSSPFANFLLKLEESEEASEEKLADVTDEIAEKLLKEREAKTRINDIASRLLAATKKDPATSLEDILKAQQEANAPKAPEPAKDEEAKDGEEPTGADATEKKEETPKASPWDKLRVATTGPFARMPRQSYKFNQETKQIEPTLLSWSDIPRLGNSPELARQAFETLTVEKPVYQKIYKNADIKDESFYVVRLKSRTAPKDEDKLKNTSQIRSQLRGELSRSWLGGWQTVIYQPTAKLKDISPWLHTYLEEAKRTGKVTLDADFIASSEPLVESVTTPPGDAKEAAPKTDDKK